MCLFLQLISYLLYEMHLRIEYDDDEQFKIQFQRA